MADFSPETIANVVRCISDISEDVKRTVVNIKAIISSFSNDSAMDASVLDAACREKAAPMIALLKDMNSAENYEEYLAFDTVDMLLDADKDIHTLQEVDAQLQELTTTLTDLLDTCIKKLYQLFGIDSDHKNKVILTVEASVSDIIYTLLNFCNEFLKRAARKLDSIPIGSSEDKTKSIEEVSTKRTSVFT